jgi:hypothetical protein
MKVHTILVCTLYLIKYRSSGTVGINTLAKKTLLNDWQHQTSVDNTVI